MIHLNSYKLRLHMTQTKIIIFLNTESILYLQTTWSSTGCLFSSAYSLNLFIVQITSLKTLAIVFQFLTTWTTSPTCVISRYANYLPLLHYFCYPETNHKFWKKGPNMLLFIIRPYELPNTY